MRKKLVARVYDIGTDGDGPHINLFDVWETKHKTFFKQTGRSDSFDTRFSSEVLSYKKFLQILKENGYISKVEWIKERSEKEEREKASKNVDTFSQEVDPLVRELYKNLETMCIEDLKAIQLLIQEYMHKNPFIEESSTTSRKVYFISKFFRKNE